MGYNRNFSQYVTDCAKAADQLRKDGKVFSLTLGRNDTFAEDALDECFERNQEGMLANMMCHELMVLITYFGLTASKIKEIVVDRAGCKSEVRRGVKDFRKVKFTIKTVDGASFHLWGDRCGGEYCEAVIKVNDIEVFKGLRPDPSLQLVMDKLEKAQPGCQPYFYLQDGEYAELKQAIFTHAMAAGSHSGLVQLDAAVETMAVIDLVQKELVQPASTIALSIANHPSSWGVDFADSPTNPPWQDVLRCIGEAGFDGTELGPVGYYKPEQLSNKLKESSLVLVAGNIFEKLHVTVELPAVMEKVHTSCKTLKEHHAKYFVIVPTVGHLLSDAAMMLTGSIIDFAPEQITGTYA